jgi:hypothetical protein
MNLELMQSNAAALKQYADLVGISPEAFLNAFLEEFLVNRFSNPDIPQPRNVSGSPVHARRRRR